MAQPTRLTHVDSDAVPVASMLIPGHFWKISLRCLPDWYLPLTQIYCNEWESAVGMTCTSTQLLSRYLHGGAVVREHVRQESANALPTAGLLCSSQYEFSPLVCIHLLQHDFLVKVRQWSIHLKSTTSNGERCELLLVPASYRPPLSQRDTKGSMLFAMFAFKTPQPGGECATEYPTLFGGLLLPSWMQMKFEEGCVVYNGLSKLGDECWKDSPTLEILIEELVNSKAYVINRILKSNNDKHKMLDSEVAYDQHNFGVGVNSKNNKEANIWKVVPYVCNFA